MTTPATPSPRAPNRLNAFDPSTRGGRFSLSLGESICLASREGQMENSPAIHRWVGGNETEQVPEGRQRESFVPPGLVRLACQVPSDESLGYFQAVLSDAKQIPPLRGEGVRGASASRMGRAS